MMATTTDVTTIPHIDHDEAMRITASEFDRTIALLGKIGPAEWAQPTDCVRWTVRDIALHLLGAAEANASLPEQLRQMRKGSKLKATVSSPYWWDGANEYQIAKHAELANADIATAYASIAPKATKARTKMPKLVRSLPVLNLPEPVGRKPLSYLSDMGFTRDVWVHRVDISRATGIPMELTPEHDGRIVADIVAEWATTHGVPFTLELSGPAGGTYRSGDAKADGAEFAQLDAVDFVRIISGRGTGAGILEHLLPL